MHSLAKICRHIYCICTVFDRFVTKNYICITITMLKLYFLNVSQWFIVLLLFFEKNKRFIKFTQVHSLLYCYKNVISP